MSIDRSEPVQSTLYMYAQLLKKGVSREPPAESTKFLLERFKNPQLHILMEFDKAKTEEGLDRVESLVNALIKTHANMWKTAVEANALGTLDLLRQLLNNIRQFDENTYAARPDSDLSEDYIAEIYLDQKKQLLANNFRRRIEELRFASYGWAIYLFTEDDFPASSVKQILEGPIREDFGSVTDLSDVFFRMRESDTIMDVWEQWNMDREMDGNFGVAVTGMAVNTWLLEFYCATLVWIASREDNNPIASQDPGNSPILDYSERVIHIDSVIDTIESYKEEYPLTEFIENEEALVSLCDDLIQYFKAVNAAFEERERDWTREQPIDDGIVRRFAEKVNGQVNSNTFRTAFLNTNGISEDPSINEEEMDGFSVSASLPRRLFVDTGIDTFFNNNFSPVLEEYRAFVINKLSFQTEQVSSYIAIPDSLDKITSNYDVEVIITGDAEAANVLRSHEKSNRTSNQTLKSYLEYSNVPVLNDVGTDFLALALFSEGYEYIEQDVDEPVSVTLVPGEEVAEWSDLDDNNDARDWVKISFAYKAVIDSNSQNGIVLRM